MNLLQTIVLSIVQGITELLPLSSSGHLILASKLINLDSISTYTLTTLHLGTTLAIILFNWKFLFSKIATKLRLFTYIIIATIPAGLFGVVFGDYIEAVFRGPGIIALMLIFIGLLMIFVDSKYGMKALEKVENEDMLNTVSFKQIIITGFAQSLALIPGVSRSGITTVAGVFSGISQYTALRLSFILGIPILMGSFIYTVIKTENGVQMLSETNNLLGILITFIIGYISLWFLEKISKKRFLKYFGLYRIVVGIIILLTLI